MADHQILKAKVASPEGVLFEGDAIAVSGENHTGKFAILPGHANFVSIIHDKITIHTGKHEAEEISIKDGVLACRNNKVDVYVGITNFSEGELHPHSSEPQPEQSKSSSSKNL